MTDPQTGPRTSTSTNSADAPRADGSVDRDLVADLYRAFNRRDADGWLAGFAREATWTNVPTGEVFVGVQGQRENYDAWNVPFPEGQCVDLRISDTSRTVVVEFKGDGVNTGPLPGEDGPLPPTHRRVTIAFCDVHEVRDGSIHATRRYWDQASVAAQMGEGS